MGCFNLTCGLTGLPIMYKEPVVIVTFKKMEPILFPVYDREGLVIDGRFREIDRKPSMDEMTNGNGISKIESINFGTYDDYGWISEDKKQESYHDERPDFRSVYFHRWAWDWCLSFQNLVSFVKREHEIFIEKFLTTKRRIERISDQDVKGLSARYSIMDLFKDMTGLPYEFFDENYSKEDFWKPFMEVQVVFLVCQEMRKDPIHMNNFMGSQIGQEALILNRRLIPMIKNHIDKIEKKHNEENEYEWDDGSNDTIFWYAKTIEGSEKLGE